MQGTVAAFDAEPDRARWCSTTARGGLPGEAFTASRLRLLRVGQRVKVDRGRERAA